MKYVLMFLFVWIFSHSICCGAESENSITANLNEIRQEADNEQESLVLPLSVTPIQLPIGGGLVIFGNIWGDGVEELGDPGEHASYSSIPFQTLQDEERKQPASLYVRMKWDANQYFADHPQTIPLCKAIEEGSVEKVDQAIADGADVNAIGLDHMTPLMWAFPSSFEVFEHLLRKGANPNVAYSGRYNFHSFLDTPPFTRNFAVVGEAQYAVTPFSFFRIDEGMSSLNVAEACADSRWLKAILENGGDPNAGTKSRKFSPAGREAVVWKRYDNFWLLCEAELNLNGVAQDGCCPLHFSLAIFAMHRNSSLMIALLGQVPDWQNDFNISCILIGLFCEDGILYVPSDESEFIPSEELLQALNLNEEKRSQVIAACKRDYVETTAFRKAMLDYIDAQGFDMVKAEQQWRSDESEARSAASSEKKIQTQMWQKLPELDVLARLPNRTLTGKQGVP